ARGVVGVVRVVDGDRRRAPPLERGGNVNLFGAVLRGRVQPVHDLHDRVVGGGRVVRVGRGAVTVAAEGDQAVAQEVQPRGAVDHQVFQLGDGVAAGPQAAARIHEVVQGLFPRVRPVLWVGVRQNVDVVAVVQVGRVADLV